MLAASGELHVVIPARSYETTFHGHSLDAFHQLRAAATTVTELDYPQPSESAYHAASTYIVEHCELLVAVWDGPPARGLGGHWPCCRPRSRTRQRRSDCVADRRTPSMTLTVYVT